MRPRRLGWTFSWAGLVAAAMLLGAEVRAQGITVDGRLSAARTLVGPNYAIGAELGRQVGGNLFHSFGRFGLNQGEAANFSGPTGVNNVIGRVTGGAQSSIDGTVRSAILGANLYLINPAGVVFGPNARVNVSGSFHASSADYLRMRDGARFQATNPDASTLTAAPPEAFGFLSANPRPVEVNGAGLGPVRGTLGLVGGPVTISGGVLSAPSGTVHIASAAGPGEVPVDPRAGPTPTVGRSGPVRVERSLLSVSDEAGRTSGGSVFVRAGTLDVTAASVIDADNYGPGRGGPVSLRGDGAVTISQGALVQSLALAAGRGADIQVATAPGGTVALDAARVTVGSLAAGEGGALSINTGALAIRSGAVVLSEVQASGAGGRIDVSADSVLLEGAGARILSQTVGAGLVDEAGRRVPAGAGGTIRITGGTLTVRNGSDAGIISNATGDGSGGAIAVSLAGDISVSNAFGITTFALPNARFPGNQGRAGNVAVATSGNIAIDNTNTQTPGAIASLTSGSGDAGSVAVKARNVTLRGNAGILSNASNATAQEAITVAADGDLVLEARGPGQAPNIGGIAQGAGNGGSVLVTAQNIRMLGTTGILSGTATTAGSGGVTVEARGDLLIDNRNSAVEAQIGSGILPGAGANRSGNAGPVTVNARNITLLGNAGVTSFNTQEGGGVGNLTVSASGNLVLDEGGLIRADTSNNSAAADVAVSAAGRIDLSNTSRISSSTSAQGRAGTITVNAGTMAMNRQAFISSSTSGPGDAGRVDVTVRTGGALEMDGGGGNTTALTGIASQALPGSTGNAGTVSVSAPSIAMRAGGGISSATFGPGNAGQVEVTVRDGGALAIDGAGNGAALTGINSQAVPRTLLPDGSVRSGNAGRVTVSAGSIAIRNLGGISSSTSGPGNAGQVEVTVRERGALAIDGAGNGANFTGIFSQAEPGSTGNAGTVRVSAGNAAMRAGGGISSTTFGPGNAGQVEVTVRDGGALAIDGAGNGAVFTGITSQAEPRTLLPDGSVRSGNAGTVTVSAGSLAIRAGGAISSTTRGAGAGGSVVVKTPGALLLDGEGVASTQVAASAIGIGSGNAGNIVIDAGAVTVRGGARIDSSTFGPGRGGSVGVTAGSEIRLGGPGLQIATTSDGAGAAGSITVSAPRIVLRDGAGISTRSQRADGGDITIGRGDLLYLQRSSITTSVADARGDGGNIFVEPRLVVLDRSLIQANAVGGNGGRVDIRAGQFVQSASGSAVTATSTLGVSGEVFITGPPLNLNGSLVVLASELRAAAALLREGCATRGAAPRSSLLVAGRGGQRQGAAEATLPALYIANRPVRAVDEQAAEVSAPPPVRTSVGLSSRCD